MRVITYREFSHLCVKILITVILSLCHHRIPYSIAVGTNHHLAALNKSGSYVGPWCPIPNFFRGYESSLYLQTLLLLDLWSQAVGLGGDAFSSIKSAPIIYYIQIPLILQKLLGSVFLGIGLGFFHLEFTCESLETQNTSNHRS